MASSSFRDSMNSLGWSRRNEQPANTNPPNPIMGTLSKLNPFGGEGYGIRLPTTEGEAPGAPLPQPTRRQEEEGWFARKSLPAYTIPQRLCLGTSWFPVSWTCSHHAYESRGGAWALSVTKNMQPGLGLKPAMRELQSIAACINSTTAACLRDYVEFLHHKGVHGTCSFRP